MQLGEGRISSFLEKKFRLSKSHFTTTAYKVALNRFEEFLKIKYDSDVDWLIPEIREKRLDPLDVLDEYYTYLSQYLKGNGDGLRSATVVNYVITAKEFLNSEGCKVYKEDMQQKFRLPKITKIYEKGLTKDIINRVLRLANPKLAAAILIACSSGMRIAEIIQLKLSDIDLSTNPTTILIRADTTKTRETRITHISSEATRALKDYLARESKKNDDYLFLITSEERLKQLRERLAKNDYTNHAFRIKDENRLPKLESQIKNTRKDVLYVKNVKISRHNMESQLLRLLKDIPDLNAKNENGRFSIHFHAFRAWFKTQVTDAHQSDFAEALIGHKSIKLVYYRQNDESRAKIYLEVEHAITINDTEMDKNYYDLQKDNQELRRMVEGLSGQLKKLESQTQE